MEFLGANCEGQWSSLSGMYTAEEADFMSQLLGNCSFPGQSLEETGALQTGLWHGHGGESLSSEMANDGDNVLFPVSSHENFYLSDSHQSFDANVSSMSMDFCIGDCLNQDMSNNLAAAEEENCNAVLSDSSRKRTRNSIDVQKGKRNVKAKKKNQKALLPCSNDEDGNGGVNVQSTSSCSEDVSDGSQETSSLSSKNAPAALNSNGKTRASRGSATDPQSLYARKRRERINERLKILQNLVPNGTKVDISTMLEEAVEYVKFLQLQIKLLSSDDMWMYAPIAYNGMDIGLDFKVPATKQS